MKIFGKMKNLINIKNLKTKFKRPRFSNLKVGARLITGFMIVIILAGIVGFVGIRGFSSISKANNIKADAYGIKSEILACRNQEKDFINTKNPLDAEEVNAKIEDLQTYVEVINTKVHDAQSLGILSDMKSSLTDYGAAFNNYVDTTNSCSSIVSKLNSYGTALDSIAPPVRQLVDEKDPIYVQTYKIQLAYAATEKATNQWMNNPNDENLDSAQKAMLSTKNEVDTIAKMAQSNKSPMIMQIGSSYSTVLNKFQDLDSSYLSNYNSNIEYQKTMVSCGDRIVGSSNPMNSSYGGAELLNIIASDKASSAKNSAQMLMIIFIVGAIVSGLVIAYLLQRGISKPINVVKRALQQMAGGDLSANVKVSSKDEIGQMSQSYVEMQGYMNEMATAANSIADGDLTVAVNPKSSEDSLGNAFQKMVVNLRELIQQVQGNAIKLNEASGHLSGAADEAGKATQGIAATSQQLAKGAGEQAQNVQEVTKAVGQLSTAVGQIAQGAQEQSKSVDEASAIVGQVSNVVSEMSKNAQSANNSSKEANEAAKAGMAAVSKTVEGMGKIKSSMDVVTGKITRLGERSAEIGKIVKVIEDIAAQTNLLALNAAIEAARAGDQGRGFAVVADEVRKLADRVATATKEISSLISAVRGGAADCIKATDEGSKEVAEGYRLADEAGKALSRILASAEAVSQQIQKISDASEDVRLSAEHMVKTIDNVSKVVEQNSAATQEMAANSDQVARSIEGIAGITEQNSAATEESSAAAEEMSAQVEEVVASSQTLTAMAKELQQAVIVFKLSKNGTKDKVEVSNN